MLPILLWEEWTPSPYIELVEILPLVLITLFSLLSLPSWVWHFYLLRNLFSHISCYPVLKMENLEDFSYFSYLLVIKAMFYYLKK